MLPEIADAEEQFRGFMQRQDVECRDPDGWGDTQPSGDIRVERQDIRVGRLPGDVAEVAGLAAATALQPSVLPRQLADLRTGACVHKPEGVLRAGVDEGQIPEEPVVQRLPQTGRACASPYQVVVMLEV